MESYGGYQPFQQLHYNQDYIPQQVDSSQPHVPPQLPNIALQSPGDAIKVECHHELDLASRLSQIQWGREIGRFLFNGFVAGFIATQPRWALAATPLLLLPATCDQSTSVFNGIAIGLILRGGSNLLKPLQLGKRNLDILSGMGQLSAGLGILSVKAWAQKPAH